MLVRYEIRFRSKEDVTPQQMASIARTMRGHLTIGLDFFGIETEKWGVVVDVIEPREAHELPEHPS